MTGKSHVTEPPWRPLAQKLYGFIKHTSVKSKRSSVTTDEKTPTSRFKRQKKIPSQENALEFKPLEVDLNLLEGIHLSEGWPESDTRDALYDQNGSQPSVPESSTTPIGDLFSNKSIFDIPISEEREHFDRLSGRKHDNNGRRPFSMVETRSITFSRTSAELPWSRNTQDLGSILDRGRPVEPRGFATDHLRNAAGLRHEVALQANNLAAEKAVTLRDLSLEASKGSEGRNSSLVTKLDLFSQGLPGKLSDLSNRHSMYAAVVTSSSNIVSATANTTPKLRSASAIPLDRIQAWQKSITSEPTSASAAGLASGSGSTLTSAVKPQADIPVRRVSTRGVGNRLAWIRELEEKKPNNSNGDLNFLKKQAGSVSDRLAMFESKQAQSASPIARRLPVARSNSTASRLSWAGFESASSTNGNATATPRTSIDTFRSSHRASSVMSYYDDSFREKMESVVGGQVADKDNSYLEEKQGVTTRFVPVKLEKGEVKPSVSLLEKDASITTKRAERSEKVDQSSQQDGGDSTIASDSDERSQVMLSTAELRMSKVEPRSFQEETVATLAEIEMMENSQSSQLEVSTFTSESEREPQSSQSEVNAPTLVAEKE